MSALIKSLAFLFILVFVASCTPSKILLVPDAESYTTIPATHGMVALRLVDTDGGLPLDSVTLAPKDVNEAEENKYIKIEVRKVSDGGVYTFLGVVPVGQYSITNFHGFKVQGQLIFSRDIPVAPSFGTFKVASGQMTNLGTALYYAKPDGDFFRHMMARNGVFDEAVDIMQQDLGQLALSVSNLDSPIVWDQDGYADERFDLYLNIIQNPLSVAKWQLLGDELVVLSKAGAMLRADQSDNWALDFVDTDLPLLMIDQNSRGDQVVCGEGAALFLKPSGRAEWVELAVPDGAELIATRIDATGRIYVVDRQPSSLTVYARNASDEAQWTPLLVYRRASGWLSVDADRAAQAAADAENASTGRVKPAREIEDVTVSLIGDEFVVVSDGITHSVDMINRTATKIDTPKKFRSIIDTGNGFVGIWESSIVEDGASRYQWAESIVGPWRPIKHDFDVCPGEAQRVGRQIVCGDGRTRKSRSIRLMGFPILASNDKMYAAIRTSSSLVSQEVVLGESSDGGASWVTKSDNSEILSRCRVMLPGFSEKEILIGCDTTDGKIYSFDPDSGEYSLLRAPVNF